MNYLFSYMPDFRFRLPSINDLNDTQKIAYRKVEPLLVTGGPGSGKTVVSIFRFLKQIGNNQNAVFFTFNRTLMSAIRGTLRQRADILLPDLNEQELKSLLSNNIGSLYEWYAANFYTYLSEESGESIAENFESHVANRGGKYSQVFIDEAQDLRPEIVEAAPILGDDFTCGADRSQDLQRHYPGPADDIIFNLLKEAKHTVRQELTQNYRNTRQIFDFARKFVPEDDNVQSLDIEELPNGEKPEISYGLNWEEQLELILKIIMNNPNSNIGILTHTKKEVIRVKEYLEVNGFSCNGNAPDNLSFSYYCNKMPVGDRVAMEESLKSPFILMYESCKGLEFDIVIMPFFDTADWALTHFRPNDDNPELDAEGNPKYWSIPNHYYVAATRARSQLFVMCNQIPDIMDFYKDDETFDLSF